MCVCARARAHVCIICALRAYVCACVCVCVCFPLSPARVSKSQSYLPTNEMQCGTNVLCRMSLNNG